MNVFYAILLGLIQGLTEFLPVSSSGHLVAFQQIFNIEEASMAFDVVLHLGTLVAVVAFYFNDLKLIVKEFFLWVSELLGLKDRKSTQSKSGYRVIMFMLVIASIPTAIIGILFNDIFEKMFSSIHIIGFTLLITGVILWLANNMLKGHKKAKDMSIVDALTIGLLQGVAITPGISRSGSTIFAGLFRKLDVDLATKFSFLLSIPAILGAAILEGRKVIKAGLGLTDAFPMLLGAIVAMISGYLAIRFFVSLIKKNKLNYFSYYCWTVGALIIIYSFVF